MDVQGTLQSRRFGSYVYAEENLSIRWDDVGFGWRSEHWPWEHFVSKSVSQKRRPRTSNTTLRKSMQVHLIPFFFRRFFSYFTFFLVFSILILIPNIWLLYMNLTCWWYIETIWLKSTWLNNSVRNVNATFRTLYVHLFVFRN